MTSTGKRKRNQKMSDDDYEKYLRSKRRTYYLTDYFRTVGLLGFSCASAILMIVVVIVVAKRYYNSIKRLEHE